VASPEREGTEIVDFEIDLSTGATAGLLKSLDSSKGSSTIAFDFLVESAFFSSWGDLIGGGEVDATFFFQHFHAVINLLRH